MRQSTLILGAGMTGLAAGIASGASIYEAGDIPGGICASYYLRPGTKKRLFLRPEDGEAYRFELGGGHWIFGGDPSIRQFINRLTPLKDHVRKSSVYFHDEFLYVPYPLQNHLRYLDGDIAARALAEMAHPQSSFHTMQEWLDVCFGPTLCQQFFFPFHELYTAGLYKTIAPQDAYKSPINLETVIQGALRDVLPVGYNASFRYPDSDLNTFARAMAKRCDIHYSKRAVKIDVKTKQVTFSDGSAMPYSSIISTLPLNKMLDIAGIELDIQADPFTSVLVLNIGARKGPQCPDEHWLYNPDARSGFHRVGFYSNIDISFLPKSAQAANDRVSIYIERAYPGGADPDSREVQEYCEAVTAELQEWGFIREVEVMDPTWVEVAYTWGYPDSRWKDEVFKVLEAHDIYQVGRYGRWAFQGIADSIRDGFIVGASFRN